VNGKQFINASEACVQKTERGQQLLDTPSASQLETSIHAGCCTAPRSGGSGAEDALVGAFRMKFNTNASHCEFRR